MAEKKPKVRILEKITARERQVLALVAEGLSSKRIAAELGIGARTVETHREHLRDKLGARNTAALVGAACALGLIRPQAPPTAQRDPCLYT